MLNFTARGPVTNHKLEEERTFTGTRTRPPRFERNQGNLTA